MQSLVKSLVVDADVARITLELPVVVLRPLMFVFQEIANTLADANHRATYSTGAVRRRIELGKPASEHYRECYETAVITMFREKLPDLTPDAAFKETNSQIKATYPNSSYEMVRKILIKSGEFKKCGYYQKKLLTHM